MAGKYDYTTSPANILPGIQMLGQRLDRRAGFERERVKEGKAENLKKQAAQMLGSTPEEMMKFVKANPGSIDVYNQMLGVNKDIMVDSAKRRLLNGEDPIAVATEEAESIDAKEGEDATGSVENLVEHMTNPDAARKKDEMLLALYDPKAYKTYMASQGKGNVKGGKPTADIINYGQAKEGGYAGSFMDFLAEKKTKPDAKTKDIKEYEYGQEHPDFIKGEETTGFGDFTEEQKNEMADQYTESGKFEFTGRSMEIKKHNAEIKKRSLERQKAKGVDAINTYYNQLDKKGMTADINAQQKKFGSMRSFAGNIDKQAKKIDEVGKRLYKYDTKILNVPINVMMKKIVGSPDRAVMELLIGELSEEIGKLASGATDSVAALSEGGREKWDAIFDTNLSFNDLNALVAESKEVAHMRIDSMKESLAESRRIRKGGKIKKVVKKYNPATGGFD